MSNPEMKTFTCPKCGWTIKTPFGDEDNAEHTKLHNAKHHSVTTRARISKNDLLKLQRK